MNQRKYKKVFEEYYRKLYTQPTTVGEEDLRDFLDKLDLPAKG